MKDKSWFIYHDVEHLGPYPLEEIVEKAKKGEISDDRLIWKEGEPSWIEIKNHPSYSEEVEPELPPLPVEEDELPPLPIETQSIHEEVHEKEVLLFSDDGIVTNELDNEPYKEDEASTEEFLPQEESLNSEDIPQAPTFAEVPKKEKKSKQLSVILSVILFFIGLGGASYWWLQGTKNRDISLPKIESIEKKNLEKVISAPTDKTRYQLAFSEDGEEIIFASNLKQEALIRLTMYAVKGRILNNGRITVVSSAHFKDGKGVFKKLTFRRGKKLYHGEYAFKVEGYFINSNKGIDGLIPFEMKQNQILELRNQGKDFEYRDTELFYPSTKKAFEIQLQKYKAKTTKLEKPLRDRKQRYETYMQFLERVGVLYRDEIKTIQSGRKITQFENEYNQSVGPYLRDLIIDSNKVHVSLVNLNPEESKAYSDLTQFGKEIGFLAADFVKKTESLKKISDEKRQELLKEFNQTFEEVKIMGKEAIDDIRYELSGQSFKL